MDPSLSNHLAMEGKKKSTPPFSFPGVIISTQITKLPKAQTGIYKVNCDPKGFLISFSFLPEGVCYYHSTEKRGIYPIILRQKKTLYILQFKLLNK